ncbi:MAG TPA: UDP-N-acetylmuramoyl-tripeptide--D-alanyl-D-alanine ligase [Patescibacteria group bacterium]|nr:UDP-N-acetylmuramoyl-tripeptide--D-alanyl-D-alanine ligase [Patescibacteria group bacterium]
MKKVNPIIKWWVTPKLPLDDVFAKHNFISQWITHPVKRRLAKWYLSYLKAITDIKVIGITGSAGKTTTKEMLASILKLDGKTVYSSKNVDSVYNIPNTILKTPPGTKYLILEMGVEYPGEMDFYLWLAKPDIGVITNIFPTHIEYLKNEEGVLKEKSKLVLNLSENSAAVLNSTNTDIKKLAEKIKAKVIWIPKNSDPLAQNAFTAATVADYLGINIETIKRGLSEYKKPEHRLSFIAHKSGAVIFDDTYNSNPKALIASLGMFIEKAGGHPKIAVIGDMLELGKNEEELHREVGKEVAKKDFQVVIGVGKASSYLIKEIKKRNKYTKTYLVESSDKVLPILTPSLYKGAYIFIKGSRSIGLDKLVDELS